MDKPFSTVAIIGLGLIGSSIARAVCQQKMADTVIGVDANEISLAFARKQGFIDKSVTDPSLATQLADLIIIATPTGALARVCEAIKHHIKPGAIVMDTGSVKRLPLAIMQEILPTHALIIPAHPIAGSEQSGVSAGKAELFEKKRLIITPDSPIDEASFKRITEFWQGLGARVEAMPADMHDRIYGYVSHLPQLLAFAAGGIANPSAHELENSAVLSQFMRLYDSDTVLWSNILHLNSDIILPALDRYIGVIEHIIKELGNAPADALITDAKGDTAKSRHSLFPRIIASCLITTVMEAEKNAGLSFARYAGSGFADFTAPAHTAPDKDLEDISNQYRHVIPLLSRFVQQLVFLRGLIAADDEALLAESLK